MDSRDQSVAPSATVVLVRAGDRGPEVLMVKRHARVSFGSAYAFPGGVVEGDDRELDEDRAGLRCADADRVLGLADEGLAYFSAAIREVFEETGVLLGEARIAAPELEQARAALNAGEIGWNRFLARYDVRLSCHLLSYIGFWITPEGSPRRYTTRFFLAPLPPGQVARHCGGEVTDSCWLRAADVLRARREKRMKLIYPTRKTLESLAVFDSLDAMLDWAHDCARSGRVVCDAPTPVDAPVT